jgi:hypothetical protein
MNNDDFIQMDDPAFLAERTRVRETIEALQARMRKLNEEFDRRAGAKWRAATGCQNYASTSALRSSGRRKPGA